MSFEEKIEAFQHTAFRLASAIVAAALLGAIVFRFVVWCYQYAAAALQ